MNAIFGRIRQHPYMLMLVLFSLNYFILVGSWNSIYWDDWAFWLLKPAVIRQVVTDTGRPIFGLLYTPFYYYWPGFVSKLTMFALYLAPVYLLSLSFKRLNLKSPLFLIFIPLIIGIAPFNFARISIIDITYAISYTTLFIACFYLLKFSGDTWAPAKIQGLIMVALSFLLSQTQSTIPLFLLVLLAFTLWQFLAVGKLRWQMPAYGVIGVFLARILEGWVGRGGPYQDYNRIGILSFLKGMVYSFPQTLKLMAQPFTSNPFEVTAIGSTWISIAVVVFILGLDWFWTRRINKPEETTQLASLPRALSFIAFGIFLTMVGVFPYTTLQKWPEFTEDWSSRHQLLVPIGFSFFTAGLVVFPRTKTAKYSLAVFLVVLFTLQNIGAYLWYFWDGIKQDQIIEQVQGYQPELPTGLYGLYDETGWMNARHRRFRNYELSGMFKFALHGKLAFASDFTQRGSVDAEKLRQEFIGVVQEFRNYPTHTGAAMDEKIAYPIWEIKIKFGECTNMTECTWKLLSSWRIPQTVKLEFKELPASVH